MEKAVETPSIEDILEGELTREKFKELRRLIHNSFTNYRYMNRQAIELLQALEEPRHSGEKKALSLKAGIVLAGLGRYEDALDVLSAVKERKDAQYYLALAYMHVEQYEKAVDALSRCSSDDIDALALLAEVYIMSGRAEKAADTVRQAGLDNEDSVDACYLNGRLAESRGEYERAMELYEKAVTLDPEHVPSMFRLALNHDMNGQDQKAIELYEKCAGISPTDVSVLVNLGTLYEDQELYYEAIECYKRILAIDPAHRRAGMYLKDAKSSLTMWVDEEEIKKMKLEDEVLKIPVSDFELSVRSRNCLERMGITTLGDLTRVSEPDLLTFKNFGETSLNEIRDMLAEKGLRLGQALEQPEDPRAQSARAEKELEKKLKMDIMELNLSTRARKCMEKLNIKTVGELLNYSEEDLLNMQNFGRTSVNELKEKLGMLNLELEKKKKDSP